MQDEIIKLAENGNYWGEEPKVEFHENEIIFGYPWIITEAIFNNIIETIKAKIKLKCETERCQHQFWCEDNVQGREFSLLEVDNFRYRNSIFTSKKVAEVINKRLASYAIVNHSTISVINADSFASISEFFEKLFKKEDCQGAIVGEEPHGSELARLLLFEVESYEKYVKAVGLEGFFPNFHQKLLDDYLKSQHQEPPIELIAWARIIDKFADKDISYINLLKKLKEHNIRPLAIDNFKSWVYAVCHNDNHRDRYQSMNLITREIIQQEIKDGEGYLLFVGSGHSFNNPYSHSLKQLLPRTKTLIVSEVLQYPPNGRKISNYNVVFNYSEKRHTFENKYSGPEKLEADIIFTPLAKV